MDFNIRDLLAKKNLQQNAPEDEIVLVLQKYIINLKNNNITFVAGKIYLKNISPTQKTHIKLHKKEIIQILRKKDIVLRDII